MTSPLMSFAERKAEEAIDLEAFSGFSLTKFRSDVQEALSTIGRLGIFEQYTKHDISHVDGILASFEWIIPQDTQKMLTSADWLMLVLGSYLHDFGLIVTRSEFQERHKTLFPDFKSGVNRSDVPSTRDYLAEINRLSADEQERFLYQEFVRSNHGHRIEGWLAQRPDKRLGFDQNVLDILSGLTRDLDDVFVEDLGLICQSHNLDDIANISKYAVDKPYGRNPAETANLQYIAILLRAADLLHITSDRTPAVAAKIVNPSSPVSQAEWAKQRAVRSVRPKIGVDADGNPDRGAPTDTVEIHARFNEAEGYFGLNRYLQYAEKELVSCYRWAAESQRSHASRYLFPWKRIDDSKIEAKGFEPRPFEFELDQHRILDLLTGHTLYNDTGVVVRELVQNSIDAVRLRRHQYDRENHEQRSESDRYEPAVDVFWDADAGTLRVLDNGTGMTQQVLEENFLRVGSSRYQDESFKRKNPDFSAISRFGIGVLSAFMIADDVEVLTVNEDDEEARLLTLRSVHGKYLVKLVDKNSSFIPEAMTKHGTQITLRVRPSARVGDVLAHLKRYVVVPRCRVRFHGSTSESTSEIGYDSVKDALIATLLRECGMRLDAAVLIDQLGSDVQVRQTSYFGLDIAYAVRWNKWFEQWQFCSASGMREWRQQAPLLGICVEGIRVTGASPGFTANSVLSLANATGTTAPRTNVARGALERTKEYDDLLSAIYAMYTSHIASEVRALETERGKSLTRAVGEASFLAADIVNGQPESREHLLRQLRNVPAFVIERGGQRNSMSLAQLAELDALVTVDSPLVRHAEHLLASVTASASVAQLLSALGEDSIAIGDVPTLCGDLSLGYFNDQFRREWNPAEIDANHDQRMVRCTWEPAEHNAIWVNAFDDPTPMLPELSYLMSGDFLRRFEVRSYIWFPVGPIKVTGLTQYDGVRVANRTLALPNSCLTSVRAASADIQSRTVSCFTSWLDSVARNFVGPSDSEARSERVKQFLMLLKEAGTDSVIDLDSVEEFLTTTGRVRIFDAMRWDRQFGDQSNEGD